jgi:hypothetical protein
MIITIYNRNNNNRQMSDVSGQSLYDYVRPFFRGCTDESQVTDIFPRLLSQLLKIVAETR